jgi:hypothetical protein
MALYRINLTFLDSDGDQSNVETFVQAADEATATQKAKDFANLCDNITLGQINKIALTQQIALNAAGLTLKSAPVAGSDREVKATLSFGVTGGFKSQISIPTFDKDAWTVTGGAVDGTDGGSNAPSLLITALVAGNYTDYRNGDLNAYLGGRESFRDLG